MSRQKRIILILLGCAVLLLGLVLTAREVNLFLGPGSSLFASQVDEPNTFATAADAARLCPIPLPPEATNIRYARWSQFQAFEEYMRFDAPVSVCIKHAGVIVPGQTLAPATPTPPGPPPLEQQPQTGVFHDISWFDLKAVKNAVHAGGGPGHPEVWIDGERGVFYYRLTD